MLEVSFKSNSIPQNWLVRWGLHLTYIYEIVLSLVDVRLPTIVELGLQWSQVLLMSLFTLILLYLAQTKLFLL